MATMSIRLSDSDKIAADKLFKNLGTTTNSAVNMFIKQSIRMQSFPFTPSMGGSNKSSEKLSNALEESEIIKQEMKEGKRSGHTNSKSLFEALDDEV